MKKTLKKMMALMIMAAIIITSAMPAMAGIIYNETNYDKNITAYYLDSSSAALGPNAGRTIAMYGVPGKISNVKSSNKSVVKIYDYSNYSYKYNYFHNASTGLKNSKDAYISYQAKKPGSSTVSFKVGTKTYKSKIKILKYVNPLSSLTITGFNDGKSFHKKFNQATAIDLEVKKSVSNAKLTVKVKKGWVITGLSVYDNKTSQTQDYGDYNGKSGRSSMTFNHVRLRKGNGTSNNYTVITIDLMNKTNKGRIPLYLYME